MSNSGDNWDLGDILKGGERAMSDEGLLSLLMQLTALEPSAKAVARVALDANTRGATEAGRERAYRFLAFLLWVGQQPEGWQRSARALMARFASDIRALGPVQQRDQLEQFIDDIDDDKIPF